MRSLLRSSRRGFSSVRQTALVIDGKQVVSSSKVWYDIRNPATNEVVARVPETTKEELNAAVASSKKAFESWKEVSAQQRARVMMKFHSLLNQHKDEIASLITQEQGKTLADAHGDLYRGIEVERRGKVFFFFFEKCFQGGGALHGHPVADSGRVFAQCDQAHGFVQHQHGEEFGFYVFC